MENLVLFLETLTCCDRPIRSSIQVCLARIEKPLQLPSSPPLLYLSPLAKDVVVVVSDPAAAGSRDHPPRNRFVIHHPPDPFIPSTEPGLIHPFLPFSCAALPPHSSRPFQPRSDPYGIGTSGQLPNVSCLTNHLSPNPTPPCRTCLSTLVPEGKKNIRRNTSAVVRGKREDGSKSYVVLSCPICLTKEDGNEVSEGNARPSFPIPSTLPSELLSQRPAALVT
jgi:hypothetical protein